MKLAVVVISVIAILFVWTGSPDSAPWVTGTARYFLEMCCQWKIVTSVLAFVIGLSAFMIRTDP